MKIREVAITATDLDGVAAFYRDVLQLPVSTEAGRVSVEIGAGRLVVTEGEPFAGVHHLAFGISPHDFETARRWLDGRVELLRLNGSEIIEGPAGWDSRSLYFRGPEGIVLELIARHADAGVPAGDGERPALFSISEVGLGVADVGRAVAELHDTFGLPPFPPQLTQFAPTGGHDGLFIVADTERIWFLTESDYPARGPIAVRIEAPRRGKSALGPLIDIEATGTQDQ
ncbi:VOC family protein [Nocardia sp. NPDC003345]